MARKRQVLGPILRDDRGFTFPELTVAMVIALITAGTAMVLIQMALRTEPELRERSAQIQQGRTLIERVSRELRQGQLVTAATSTGLDIVTYVHSASCGGDPAAVSIPCRVTYSCSSTACTRTERNPDGTGSAAAETVISGISGPNVFGFSPTSTDPSYVSVTFAFPDDAGGETVTVSDGVALRNHFEGAGA